MPGFFESLRNGQIPQYPTPSAKTVVNVDGQYCVINSQGETIVRYGYYRFISPFQHGLARVQTGDRYMGPRVFDGSIPEEALEYKWGIIDSEGEEVVMPLYDFIRGFDRSIQAATPAKKDGQDCMLSLRGLSKEYDAFLNSRNSSATPSRGFFASIENRRPHQHFEEFEGTYAQDVEGYSDEDIYDAFDGDPEAYWNID